MLRTISLIAFALLLLFCGGFGELILNLFGDSSISPYLSILKRSAVAIGVVGLLTYSLLRARLMLLSNSHNRENPAQEILENSNLALDEETRKKIARAAANHEIGHAPELTGKIITTRCPTCQGVQPLGQQCPWCQESTETS